MPGRLWRALSARRLARTQYVGRKSPGTERRPARRGGARGEVGLWRGRGRVFWRRASEALCARKCPLWDARTGVAPCATLALD
eukprot:4443708-Lingulodinium_polyedra.AAC.1